MLSGPLGESFRVFSGSLKRLGNAMIYEPCGVVASSRDTPRLHRATCRPFAMDHPLVGNTAERPHGRPGSLRSLRMFASHVLSLSCLSSSHVTICRFHKHNPWKCLLKDLARSLRRFMSSRTTTGQSIKTKMSPKPRAVRRQTWRICNAWVVRRN